MTSIEWRHALLAAIRDFEQRRNVSNPVVKVTILDHESFNLVGFDAGPTDEHVTFHPYPKDLNDLIEPENRPGSLPETPRAVMVRLDQIRKVEISYPKVSGVEGFGFQMPADERNTTE